MIMYLITSLFFICDFKSGRQCLCSTKVHLGDHVVPRNWQYPESKFLCKEMFGSISEHMFKLVMVNFELIVFDVIPDYPCMVDGEGKEYICQFF